MMTLCDWLRNINQFHLCQELNWIWYLDEFEQYNHHQEPISSLIYANIYANISKTFNELRDVKSYRDSTITSRIQLIELWHQCHLRFDISNHEWQQANKIWLKGSFTCERIVVPVLSSKSALINLFFLTQKVNENVINVFCFVIFFYQVFVSRDCNWLDNWITTTPLILWFRLFFKIFWTKRYFATVLSL